MNIASLYNIFQGVSSSDSDIDRYIVLGRFSTKIVVPEVSFTHRTFLPESCPLEGMCTLTGIIDRIYANSLNETHLWIFLGEGAEDIRNCLHDP
jgi:hypothetical protein